MAPCVIHGEFRSLTAGRRFRNAAKTNQNIGDYSSHVQSGMGSFSAGGAELNIRGNPHGIKHGWFSWPYNFDPIWLENCDGFEEKEKDLKESMKHAARAKAAPLTGPPG